MPSGSVQGVDELDLLLIHSDETGIQVHDAAEDRYRHAGDDDGRRGSAEPHDEQRRESGFGQTVQDDKVGLQYLRQFSAAPQKDSDENAEQRDQQKTDDGLVQCDADMQEDRAVPHHLPETQGDPRRAAEDKGIDDPCIGAELPQDQKENKDQHPCSEYDNAVAPEAGQKQLLAVRYFIHRDSAPSISH